MPRRRYDDDDGFPDIRQKPGTPSDAFGGAYGPPDSDSESGYSRPGTAGSGESGSASLTFEDWQKKAGLGSLSMGEDEFSKTDGSARDGRMRDVDNPEQFGRMSMSMADQKSRLKDMMRKGGKMGSVQMLKAAKAAQRCPYHDPKPGRYETRQG